MVDVGVAELSCAVSSSSSSSVLLAVEVGLAGFRKGSIWLRGCAWAGLAGSSAETLSFALGLISPDSGGLWQGWFGFRVALCHHSCECLHPVHLVRVVGMPPCVPPSVGGSSVPYSGSVLFFFSSAVSSSE